MIRGGRTRPVTQQEKGYRWDYAIDRGYLTPRQTIECIEFANAAMRRVQDEGSETETAVLDARAPLADDHHVG